MDFSFLTFMSLKKSREINHFQTTEKKLIYKQFKLKRMKSCNQLGKNMILESVVQY